MLIPTKQNISTVTDLRVNTLSLLKKVNESGIRYVFQRSTPKAVLISLEVFQSMLERLEDYQDSNLAKKIERKLKGKGVTLSQVAKEYGVEL